MNFKASVWFGGDCFEHSKSMFMYLFLNLLLYYYIYIIYYSPHLCVGFLFLILYPGLLLLLLLLLPPPAARPHTHTPPTHTHTAHTHTRARHLVTSTLVSRGRRGTKLASTVVLRGRRGTHGTGWRAWSGFVACDAAALWVAGVALGDIHPRFTWQAWHKTRIHRRFAWQAWHSWYWVARLVRICRLWRRGTLRGRRGTWWHPPSFHVAGVAQTRIHRRFAWQAWHSWYWVARLVRICRLWRRGTLRGRRGTWWHPPSFHVAGVAQNSHPPSFCVAGVALMVLGGALGPDLSPVTPRHFAWQAWHLVTSTFVSRGRRGTKLASTVILRGRRGTHGTGWRAWSGFVCVAGVALGDIHPRFTWQAWHKTRIHRRFAWQAWHSWYWVARLVRICRLWRRGTLRGRRGTWWHPPSFHVAGVAQTRIHRRFAWQAWHSWYWVARLVRICRLWRRGTLRGRRGTWWHPPSFHVAGVAQNSHPPSFCVAGAALMVLGGALGPDLSPVTPRHFGWQAWHLVTSTLVSRGRRGTNSHPPSFCVAGVALMVLGGALGPDLSPVTPRHFAWQAWHLVTSTFVSRGWRGTNSHPPSFCVAGVALMVLGGALGPDLSPVTPRHFAWQAWHSWYWVARLVRICRLWRRGTLRGRRGTWWHPPSFHVARCLCLNGINIGLLATRKVGALQLHLSCMHTYIHTYLPFYLLDLSPPPLSFLPSPTPLQPLKLIIGRSWLVGWYIRSFNIYIHTDFDTYSKYVTWFPLDFGCQHGPYRDDFNDVHPEMLMSAFLMHVPWPLRVWLVISMGEIWAALW